MLGVELCGTHRASVCVSKGCIFPCQFVFTFEKTRNRKEKTWAPHTPR